MNFIGHAYLAQQQRLDIAFVLGAMLPDFFGMARIHGARSEDDDVTAGMAHHHAMDEVFHRTVAFVALQKAFIAELESRGVSRGPSRAVAHVGLELLLDGYLLDEAGVAEGYLSAIDAMGPERLGRELRFRRPEHEGRYADLATRLQRWGIPTGYRDPQTVGDRLVRILEGRPRLALTTAETVAVRQFLPGAGAEVGRSLGDLVGPLLRSSGPVR